MKKALIILCATLALAPALANAAAVFTMANTDGGKIILTNDRLNSTDFARYPQCKQGSYVAKTWAPGYSDSEGCWTVDWDIDLVTIVWVTGSGLRKSYDLNQFEMTPGFKKYLEGKQRTGM